MKSHILTLSFTLVACLSLLASSAETKQDGNLFLSFNGDHVVLIRPGEKTDISEKFRKVHKDSLGLYRVLDIYGKQGLYHTDGTVLFAPKYRSISKWQKGHALVKNIHGQSNFIDNFGREIFKNSYQNIYKMSSNRFAIQKRGIWALCDENENIISSERFVHIKSFSDKLHLAQSAQNSLWGLIDKETGIYTFPAQARSIAPLKLNRALVQIDTKFGFLNEEGQLVIAPQYDKASPFNSEAHAIVKDDFLGWKKIALDGKVLGEATNPQKSNEEDNYVQKSKNRWAELEEEPQFPQTRRTSYYNFGRSYPYSNYNRFSYPTGIYTYPYKSSYHFSRKSKNCGTRHTKFRPIIRIKL